MTPAMVLLALTGIPELIVLPGEFCIRYENHYQSAGANVERVDMDGYEIVFRFYRGMAFTPDTVVVVDWPEVLRPLVTEMTLEENETGLFCFEFYAGG